MYFHPDRRYNFEFAGINYRCSYATRIENFKKKLYFFAFNINRPNVPIIAQAEIDNNLTELENLRGTVAAFLRNRLGMDTVGEIEEEDDE